MRVLGTLIVCALARRDLGLSLRAVRREVGMARKEAALAIGWPQNRASLIEGGRVKVDCAHGHRDARELQGSCLRMIQHGS